MDRGVKSSQLYYSSESVVTGGQNYYCCLKLFQLLSIDLIYRFEQLALQLT